MSIKFKRTTFAFDIYGTVVSVQKPTFGELEDFEAKLKGMDFSEIYKATTLFLLERGFTEELLKSMEPDHIGEIMDYLGGKKKAPITKTT